MKADAKHGGPVTTPYRWVVLALFVLVALISQLLWLTFAPLSSEMTALYGVTAFDVSLLSLVWPLIFVALAIPAGIFIDKHGFKKSVWVGSLFMAGFSVLRALSPYLDYNFTVLLLAQTGAAVSQPFIFGSITKLSVSWFPEKERGLATGLGTIGLFLGMMLALAVTPFLFQSHGFTAVLLAYGAVSCAGALLFVVFGREGAPVADEKAAATFALADIWTLSKCKSFLILEFGFFAVVGGFTALMTWLEEILNALHGLTIEEAGLIGGVMIVGGVVGSVVIPAISDRTNRIKPFVLLNLAVGTGILLLLDVFDGFVALSLAFFTAGFFLMSALPLVLELSSRICDSGTEGRASSLLWFFSQVGSVVLIAMVEPLASWAGSYFHAVAAIALLWVVSLLLFVGIGEHDRGGAHDTT
jgi:predicted MFS family arabinose efflux permease